MAQPPVLDQLANIIQVDSVSWSHEQGSTNSFTQYPERVYQIYDVVLRNNSDAEILQQNGSSVLISPRGTITMQASSYGTDRSRPFTYQLDYMLRVPTSYGYWHMIGLQRMEATFQAA